MTFHSRQTAFSLVEVTIALGVAALCLLAVFGLLPIGLKTTQSSSAQISASDLAVAIDADLRATSKGAAESALFGISMTTGSTIYLKEDGTVGSQTESRWRVQVMFNAPAGGSKMATSGRILVSWPAQQEDLSKAAGSENFFIALDRNG